jgi:hypothetical protein
VGWDGDSVPARGVPGAAVGPGVPGITRVSMGVPALVGLVAGVPPLGGVD